MARDPSTVGGRIAAHRKALRLTGNDMARRLDITRPYLSEIENNKAAPGRKLLAALRREFGLHPEFVVHGSSDGQAAPASTPPVQTSHVGMRLRDERNRLGLNQTDFAAAGGVQKGAQVNYESGTRAPDTDYLAGIAALGADVLYIVTGRRTPEPAPEEPGLVWPVIDASLLPPIPLH